MNQQGGWGWAVRGIAMGLVLKPVHELHFKVPTQQLVTKSPSLGWGAKSVCAWRGASCPLQCCLVLLLAHSLLRKDGWEVQMGTGSALWSSHHPLVNCEHPTGKTLHWARSSPCHLTNRGSWEGTWVPPQNCCVVSHRWLPQPVQLWNKVKNLHGG